MEVPLRIHRHIDFELDDSVILYLDSISGEKLSDDLFRHYQGLFSDAGYELQTIHQMIGSLPGDVLAYFLPELDTQDLPTESVMAFRLAGELGLSLDGPQCIRHEGDVWYSSYGEEGDETPEDFLDWYLDYLIKRGGLTCKDSILSESLYECCRLPEGEPCYSMPCPGELSALTTDEESEIEKLLSELSGANEEKLRELGLSEASLRFLLGYAKPKLSRIKITRTAKIILEDYGGREIKLDDKTKALYFLFLRHTEGLSIKDLPEHVEELLDLYQSISGRDDPKAMRQTIESLCDPFENNANISLSRIKKAFCEAFTPLLARQYYVTGERGGQRKISLDRDLVSWETIR